MQKTLEDFQKEIAVKYKLGTKLVTGHKKQYFDEATKLYVDYIINELKNKKHEN